MGWLVIGVIVAFSFVSITQAELTVKEYMAMKEQNSELVTIHVDGVGLGIAWANTRLVHREGHSRYIIHHPSFP